MASGGDGGAPLEDGEKVAEQGGGGRASLLASVDRVAREVSEKCKTTVGGWANVPEYQKPEKAAQALEMFVQGKTRAEIKVATGISFEGQLSLRSRHVESLAARRKELSEQGFALVEGVREVAMKKLEKLSENDEQLAKTSIKDLAIAYGVFQDKSFGALGETSRVIVEHRKGPSIEDVRAEIEAARAAVRAKSIEVVVSPTEPAKDEAG